MRITKDEKGQRQYGSPLQELNRGELYVVDSSLATDTACRVYTRDPENPQEQDVCALHLNRRQAAGLIKRLQAFLENS